MIQAEAVDLSTARKTVVAAIEAERDELVALSKFIHAHPEIAMQETESSAACAAFLERVGFAVERNVAGLATAFRATASGPGEGPRIAYLAEYDGTTWTWPWLRAQPHRDCRDWRRDRFAGCSKFCVRYRGCLWDAGGGGGGRQGHHVRGGCL